jgi:hypothetical protein
MSAHNRIQAPTEQHTEQVSSAGMGVIRAAIFSGRGDSLLASGFFGAVRSHLLTGRIIDGRAALY